MRIKLKSILHQKILEILICVELVGILYRLLRKRKRIEICGITAYYVLKFILFYFCLSYEKINYLKIRNSIIKIVISSDRKYFLVCIYVSKILFLALKNIYS